MVEAIKEEAVKNWPLLLLVLAMTGGGTSLGNIVFGGGDSDQCGSIDDLKSEVQLMRLDVKELTIASRQFVTIPMEVTIWDRAGRELRKISPEWQGPDIPEIRRIHFLDERGVVKQ